MDVTLTDKIYKYIYIVTRLVGEGYALEGPWEPCKLAKLKRGAYLMETNNPVYL